MARKLPPLNALKAFEVVAKAGSIAQGARELRVTQSSVSRHLAHLEAVVGVPLFERGAREIRLTPAGLKYSETVSAALDKIEDATFAVKEKKDHPPVHVCLYPTIAIKWLVPRLSEFSALHPEICVKVTSSTAPATLNENRVDFTVQQETGHQDYRYDRLFDFEILPVCGINYTESSKLLKPKDIVGHTLLQSVNRPNDWLHWLTARGVRSVDGLSIVEFGNSILAQEAAIAGVGIAMAIHAYAANDIAQGNLLALDDSPMPTGESYFLVSKMGGKRNKNAELFRDWVISLAKTRPYL